MFHACIFQGPVETPSSLPLWPWIVACDFNDGAKVLHQSSQEENHLGFVCGEDHIWRSTRVSLLIHAWERVLDPHKDLFGMWAIKEPCLPQKRDWV